MPAELYEEPLELNVGILEAVLPDSGQYLKTAYPFPSLKVTGRAEKRTFRAIVLENPHLRATVIPALGGRVLRLFDKRTNTEVLPVRDVLVPEEGGPRGAFLPDGLQIRLEENSDRLNSLGPVNVQAVEAEDEESGAQLWIGETAGPVSFNACYTLPPDRAELLVEVRALNRTFEHRPYNPGLHAETPDIRFNAVDGFIADRRGGTALRVERNMRFMLAPRQADTFTLAVTPATNGHALREGVVNWEAERLTLQTIEKRLDHKLVLLTQDGHSLEAKVDLYPERPYELPFSALPSPPVALALLDPAKNEVLRYRADEPLRETAPSFPAPVYDGWLHSKISEDELRFSTGIAQSRGPAYTMLGMRAAARGDYNAAHQSLESALLYNADDPLTWWAQAVVARLAGDEAEERAELLNAHYLAPLEPALRAESFLSQTEPQGKEPNPILKPLEETPEQFVEVACLLLEMGLFAEATRWIDEALRHEDLPMLRYLQAFALIKKTRMIVEAAQHLQAAATKPLSPPFPWRHIEREALQTLQQSFPKDERITQLLTLMPQAPQAN